MTITVSDVRNNMLNKISEDTLADEVIAEMIVEANEWVERWGFTGTLTDEVQTKVNRFIKIYAAYNSLIVARVWDSSRLADLSVKKKWEDIRDRLKNRLDDITDELTDYIGVVIESTAGFDTRPLDPARDETRIDDATIE